MYDANQLSPSQDPSLRTDTGRARSNSPYTPLSLAPDSSLDELDRWQERALCAQTDPESFFPEKGGSTKEAKKVCLGCEVRTQCLEYALSHDERFGVWGGLSERERRLLKKGQLLTVDTRRAG